MNSILEFLEKTELAYPYHLAVDDGISQLTYQELLILSKRIGTVLCQNNPPKKPIVILREKSSSTLAAMFGVLYAGDFYIIVDPSQPSTRIREILKVLDTQLIITDGEYLTLLKESGYDKKVVILQNILQTTIDEDKLNEIRKNSQDTDLLYGIFTSGSTGTPKGIVVSHQAVIKFITHFTELFEITHEDCIGNQAPFDFDVSVKDIYSSIMMGATLILIPKKFFSLPPVLLDYLEEKKVTTLIWAVSALCLVSALKGLRYKTPSKVTKILFSGEVMPIKQLKLWQEALSNAKFINLYGPTEITCNCTYHFVDREVDKEEKLPIGKAFPGRRVFLLDEQEKEIKTENTIGEICVAGESLSEGYYHNPKETEEKFIWYSFDEGKKQRCYRTGDLGCYQNNGELYFSGRKDFQIKRMGHRIELEEIEHTLEKIKGVEKSCCIFLPQKNQLIAFCLSNIQTENLHQEVKKILPTYMIPNKIIQTENLPLNKNGKTDRAYLKQQLENNK